MRQGPHEEMLGWVRTGEADLAISSPLPAGEQLASAQVVVQELVTAVPAGHRLAGRRRLRVSDLDGEQMVGMKLGYGLRKITDELCAAAGFTPELAFEGEEIDTLRGLVGAGLGIAILPPAERALPAGVAELPLSPKAIRRVGLIWAADRPLAPAAEAFRAFVLRARRVTTP